MITTRQALGLDFNAMRLAAAREAIERLALLKTQAEDIIFHLLDGRFEKHPRALCTAYRKDGEQLSDAEKRGLGLRANTFLSRKAFNELSGRGLAAPLQAHETVLLRATFTLARYQSISRARAQLPAPFRDEYKFDALRSDCPKCNTLDGTIAKGDNTFVFPPDDCICDTANYSLRPHVDWLADIDPRSSQEAE